MAEHPTLRRSICQGSDQIPELYCGPCHDIRSEIKPIAGYCINCDESLCQACYDSHLRWKQFRNHKLQVDKPTRPKSEGPPQQKYQGTTEKCPRHREEVIQSFCKSHSQICCKVCLTISHLTCDTEDISKMARHIQTSEQLEDLTQLLSMLKTGFNENLSKAKTNRSTIQSNYSRATDGIKKLKDDFDRLMTKTETLLEMVNEEDLMQSQSISKRCNVIIDQINKITANLEKFKDKGDNENIFITMTQAENEIQSLEESLSKLDTDNKVREYIFEPDRKLKDLVSRLKVLGNLSFLKDTHTSTTSPVVSIAQQMAKAPTYVKDIQVTDIGKCLSYHGSVVLPNQQLLISDYQNKTVKLIDTNIGTSLSQIQMSGTPVNITTVKTNEFAVLLNNPNKIQILNLSQNILTSGRELSINSGSCYGLAYNNKDQSFVVAFCVPGKVQIIDTSGTVMRTIQFDSKGSALFGRPFGVELNPGRSGMYVIDGDKHSVILLSLKGMF